MSNPWHFYLMAMLYLLAGAMHFVKPKVYMRIMPRYLPNHRSLVYLSGAIELLLGSLLLFSTTRNLAIYGLVAMLTVFLLVHFYMLSSKKAGAGFPKWLLILRIPIQFLLMYWALWYLI